GQPRPGNKGPHAMSAEVLSRIQFVLTASFHFLFPPLSIGLGLILVMLHRVGLGLIFVPGTKEGLPAIEEAIFAGVPVNVTLLFSREHYVAAAGKFLRGIERCIDAGLNPNVGSVASVFISRWDVAVMDKVPEAPPSLGQHRDQGPQSVVGNEKLTWWV